MNHPLTFKEGDRVIAYLSDARKAEYWGKFRFIGTVIRIKPNGLIRVDLDGTGSQDSEGHNAYEDFHPKALRHTKARTK